MSDIHPDNYNHDTHPDNYGADRAQVYEELREFLGIVADCPDRYAALMRDLPEWQRHRVEELFRDYAAAFARAEGLRMRVLRIVRNAYEAGRRCGRG